jgi:hypothetical protein
VDQTPAASSAREAITFMRAVTEMFIAAMETATGRSGKTVVGILRTDRNNEILQYETV